MPNMSYCRFENTYSDLKDCINALYNREELSMSESDYARRMYQKCKDYIEEYESYDYDVNQDEVTQ